MLRSEPGCDVVQSALGGAIITVNYSEVLKKTIERGGSGSTAASFVHWPVDRGYRIRRDACNHQRRIVSANQGTWSFLGGSCLALGIQRNCKVLTSERRMAPSLSIKVKLIRNDH
jgi:hypothetical protein